MTTSEKTKEFILYVFAKINILMQVAEGQLFLIKDLVVKDDKQRINHAIKSLKPLTRQFENHVESESIMEDENNKDVLFFTQLIDAYTQADALGIECKFMNDFYKICKQNNINLK